MIPKIIVLLIIYLCLNSKYKDSFYSNRQNFIHENSEVESTQIKNNNDINNLNEKIFSLSKLNYNNAFNLNAINFRFCNFSYIFNYRFNIIQVEYNIYFYYKNNTFIIPSDLTLYYDLHLICHIYEIKSNSSIDSLAFIHLNKYFKCIEYININEKLNFGIIIFKPINDSFNETSYINYTQYFFSDEFFNYNKQFYKNNQFFYPLYVKKEFYLQNRNISLGLKKLYIEHPEFKTKSNPEFPKNKWKFVNLFNQYFCLCQGDECLYQNILNTNNSTQICKYNFYLYLIEKNKLLYNKTYYLLADFPGESKSLDDAYPVFEKLINLKKHAYYLTLNKKILQNQKNDNKFTNHIIRGNFINGNFLEKYFSLILKLKVVISGAEYISFKNIFYNIDYITFISLTHGLNYFKTYLFKTYYGKERYDKIVISPSKKIISLALKNGWEEKDLIKICLPKWDKFDELKNIKGNNNKSIFIFFTWRIWKQNISDEIKLKSEYFNNIIKLMNNELLTDSLNKNGITLYFSLHHMIEIYKDKLNFGNNNIKYIQQNEIFQSIINSNLLVTDFSSIIFEFMYLNKPYIMFIPDSDDPNINKNYDINYFNLIKSLKEGTIDFMNKYFNINQVVDKIIYYINNNFEIDKSLKEFYNSFNLSCGNNTMKFINYLENLGK